MSTSTQTRTELDDPELRLGPCCGCRTIQGVRNIVMLPVRAPVPGTGWGCFACDLPQDGAVAVLCDDCAEAERIEEVCVGFPKNGCRVERSQCVDEFRHDLSYHPEALPGDPG